MAAWVSPFASSSKADASARDSDKTDATWAAAALSGAPPSRLTPPMPLADAMAARKKHVAPFSKHKAARRLRWHAARAGVCLEHIFDDPMTAAAEATITLLPRCAEAFVRLSGTMNASELWLSDNVADWTASEAEYTSRRNALKVGRSPHLGMQAPDGQCHGAQDESLNALDEWVWRDLVATVRARDAPHLTYEELCKLMEWKITRGKWFVSMWA